MKLFNKMKQIWFIVFVLVLCIPLTIHNEQSNQMESEVGEQPYTIINDNIPEFKEEEFTTKAYEKYSELDEFGRCGAAMACLGKELMPKEEREDISEIIPSGWQWIKYDDIEGGYLYNRCHLIGFQLSGENANEKNLITGTRYMNIEGMLPFENKIASYIRQTEHHVLYRVTPIFDDDNLVATSVKMEAYSIEDQGRGICFNVLIHNIQPGIIIDYRTGESKL